MLNRLWATVIALNRMKECATIVVTGASGPIGSNFVAELISRGRTDIASCDVFDAGEKWRNLAKAAIVDWVPSAALLRLAPNSAGH